MKKHTKRWIQLNAKMQLPHYNIIDVLEACPFSQEELNSSSRSRTLMDWKQLLGAVAFMQTDSTVEAAKMLDLPSHSTIIHRVKQLETGLDGFNRELESVFKQLKLYINKSANLVRTDEIGLNEYVGLQELERKLFERLKKPAFHKTLNYLQTQINL